LGGQGGWMQWKALRSVKGDLGLGQPIQRQVRVGPACTGYALTVWIKFDGASSGCHECVPRICQMRD
jgi:hypothetical protein